jgi:hypothetical protein
MEISSTKQTRRHPEAVEVHPIPFPVEVRPEAVENFEQKVLVSAFDTSSIASLAQSDDDLEVRPKHPRHPHVAGLAEVVAELEQGLHPLEVRPYRHPLDRRPEEDHPFRHHPLDLPLGVRPEEVPRPDLVLIR